ncbi:MAG: hypothetical protein ABIR18_09725 [Chitinophagaceae bacterium]
MRIAALAITFVAFSCATQAQLSLLPQVGFENSKTVLQYNDLNSYSPLGVKFSPQASLRLNYSTKQGHGFFVGVASSRSVVQYSFENVLSGMTDYKAVLGNMQARFEGGYRFNSPKINFGKSNQSAQKKQVQSNTASRETNNYSGRCGRSYSMSSRCGYGSSKVDRVAPKVKPTSWVRIQPSIGIGFNPGAGKDLVSQTQGATTSYDYRAGNWNTALITGADLEFGKGNKALMTVSINYFNGGNLNKQSISTVQGGKITTTTLQSDASGWNIRVGIPFSLSKSPSVKNKSIEKKEKPQNRCGYRYRCGRSI